MQPSVTAPNAVFVLIRLKMEIIRHLFDEIEQKHFMSLKDRDTLHALWGQLESLLNLASGFKQDDADDDKDEECHAQQEQDAAQILMTMRARADDSMKE